MLERIKGLAAKIEATYDTDPTVAEATDSIQTRNLTVQPLDGDFIERGLDRASLGQEGQILVARRCKIQAEVEVAGSGAAGTAPPFDQMLRACGLVGVNTPLVSEVYNPISAAFQSLWMEANKDGVQSVASGARGNLSMSFSTRQISQMNFDMTGIWSAPADVAIPTYTLTPFQTPVPFGNTFTGTLTLLGVSIPCESVSIDFQNQIEHRELVGDESVLLVDRKVVGQISFSMALLAGHDWFTDVINRTAGALNIVHGLTAGNIVTVNAPAVELSTPTYSESQGDLMMNLQMLIKPTTAGNDEITLGFT